MKRRELIKSLSVASIGISAGKFYPAKIFDNNAGKTPVITIANITDVHITDGNEAPARFKKCLQTIIKKYKPDFFLNGGDSIMDASYANVKREQVINLWQIWDDCIKAVIPGYEIYSCIGNHDPWWSAPSRGDEMYGKSYAVKRLNIPGRYYSFNKQNWHFVILDGNNKNISIDEEQMLWLKEDLAGLSPSTNVLLMSHYPILGTTQVLVGGGHSDFNELKILFYKYRQNVKICLSGHNHLSDKTFYNGVQYCCNGAMSGFWWGKGDKDSAGPGYYYETPPGFAILKLYSDGRVENEYIPHGL